MAASISAQVPENIKRAFHEDQANRAPAGISPESKRVAFRFKSKSGAV
jgi:hypothetical protein